MELGAKLKDMRQQKNLTQEELAETIGISVPMICQIERGSKVPTMVLGRQIARVFKCSMEELFEEV